MTDTQAEIKTTIDNNDVVLFMKGTATMPQCGFSSRVASILHYMEVTFKDVNVLDSDEMRQGIKTFSDWPTTPQLYVKGEFVGGCDIITEMTMSGELDKVFGDSDVAFNKEAAEAIRKQNG
jgi:monothiol glutaredoxin